MWKRHYRFDSMARTGRSAVSILVSHEFLVATNAAFINRFETEASCVLWVVRDDWKTRPQLNVPLEFARISYCNVRSLTVMWHCLVYEQESKWTRNRKPEQWNWENLVKVKKWFLFPLILIQEEYILIHN